MRTLCLIMLFHASLQLQCDKEKITAYIGGEFIFTCTYNTNNFRYSKKYWCRGDSRDTCEILADSEGKNTRRSHIIDAGRRGLYVKVAGVQFDDTGVYWVGIDKMYTDIMTKVNVVITDVSVSKPSLRPLSSLVDRPTCWGQPVTVRCGSTKGTAVGYAWYQQRQHKDFLLLYSSDFQLHCGTVEMDSKYYCIASNDISSERSDLLSVQVVKPADSSCIYVVHMQGQPVYDCADRMSTTTATTPPLTTCQATGKKQFDTTNWSLPINQTDQDLFFSRVWTGVPFWYALLRWGSFASLLVFLCIVLKCTKARHKCAKRKRRKRRAHVRRIAQLAH